MPYTHCSHSMTDHCESPKECAEFRQCLLHQPPVIAASGSFDGGGHAMPVAAPEPALPFCEATPYFVQPGVDCLADGTKCTEPDCMAAGGCGEPKPPEELKRLLAKPSRLAEFDTTTATVTQKRGAVYSHPTIDFDRVSRIKAVLAECSNPLARHALEMIAVKMARLIHSPDHLDSWVDIAGYARTGVMVTDCVSDLPKNK